MNSHELAYALLNRRVNDVSIEIILDEGGSEDDENFEIQRVELRDAKINAAYTIKSSDVVSYDSDFDKIIIKAGIVCANLEDDKL